jgi:hypothetical protein
MSAKDIRLYYTKEWTEHQTIPDGDLGLARPFDREGDWKSVVCCIISRIPGEHGVVTPIRNHVGLDELQLANDHRVLRKG